MHRRTEKPHNFSQMKRDAGYRPQPEPALPAFRPADNSPSRRHCTPVPLLFNFYRLIIRQSAHFVKEDPRGRERFPLLNKVSLFCFAKLGNSSNS